MRKKIGAGLLVIIMALALGLAVLPASAASIVYVDADASGANDGSSWSDAYTDLQSALASAEAGDEIWVAEGTYKPDDEDRSVSFELDGGQKVYGGFDGTETSREQRDWVTNQTILSGDIGTVGDSTDNSYHVVTVESADGVILDGFTVTGGNANYYNTTGNKNGGGIYISNSKLTVNNCTISQNTAISGGGIYAYYDDNGSITVTNTVIDDNRAVRYGGGLGIYFHTLTSGEAVVKNSIISNNSITGVAGENNGGGGISLAGRGPFGYGTLYVVNSTINGNTIDLSDAISQGGGIRVGGSWYGYNKLDITNSTIVNNEAPGGGGAIRGADDKSTIKNSILCANTTPQFSVGSPTVSDSLVGGDPKFVHDYDDLHLKYNSPAIDAGNNKAVPKGVTVDLDGNPRIVDSNGDGVATVDMGAFEYLTEQQVAIQELITQVGALVGAELNPGQGNALIVKLEAALQQMCSGKNNAAVNQLEAFINQVEDFMEEEILTEGQGQSLIDAANEIIVAL